MRLRSRREMRCTIAAICFGIIAVPIFALVDDTEFAGLDGNWTYRSLRNNPSLNIEDWRRELRFAEGPMRFSVDGRELTGVLFPGTDFEVALKGSMIYLLLPDEEVLDRLDMLNPDRTPCAGSCAGCE